MLSFTRWHSYINTEIYYGKTAIEWSKSTPEGAGLCGKPDKPRNQERVLRSGELAPNFGAEYCMDWKVRPGESVLSDCNCYPPAPDFQQCVDTASKCPNEQGGRTQTAKYERCVDRKAQGDIIASLPTPATGPSACNQKRSVEDQRVLRQMDDLEDETVYSNWTQAEAETFCSDYLYGTDGGQQCAGISDDLIENTLTNCYLDILLTNSTEFVGSHGQDLRESCRSVLRQDLDLYVDVEDGVYGVDPQKEMCMDNTCSGHGTCVGGTCQCDSGYVGAACSVEAASPPLISVGFVYVGCVPGDSHHCGATISVAEGTVAQDVVCLLQEESGQESVLPGLLMTPTEVICPLPTPSVSLDTSYFTVRISNDGVHWSESTEFTMYNQRCWECGGDSCWQKPGTCIIDGVCRVADEVNPLDPTLVCDAAQDLYGWSVKTASGMSVTCSPAEIVASLDVSGLVGGPGNLYVGDDPTDPACLGQVADGVATFRVLLDNCGVFIEDKGDDTIRHTYHYVSEAADDVIYSAVAGEFFCDFASNELINTEFTGLLVASTYVGSASGHYGFSMELLNADDLQPAPSQVPVGSLLLVHVHFDGPDALRLVVASCWAEPKDDDSLQHFLLQDGSQCVARRGNSTVLLEVDIQPGSWSSTSNNKSQRGLSLVDSSCHFN